MKIFTILGLFFCVSHCLYSQNSDCLNKIKTGKFTYPGEEGKVEIIRTKKTQTEVYNNGVSKLILKIQWLNDSTYVLTHKKSVNAPGCLEKGDWMKATVFKCEENRYSCEFTSNKCGNGQIVLIKLE